jgi:hypothetical protein
MASFVHPSFISLKSRATKGIPIFVYCLFLGSKPPSSDGKRLQPFAGLIGSLRRMGALQRR